MRQENPGVAKFGIALEWGSRGPEFESQHSDQNKRTSALQMSFYFEFRRPKVGSTLRDFNARGGRAAPLPLAIVMGGVGAVQGNLPQHIFSPRRRTTAGIRNASWALSVLKTAGNKKTKVSNETFVFMVGLSEANSNKFRALLDTKPSATPTAIVSPPTQDGQVVTELKQDRKSVV